MDRRVIGSRLASCAHSGLVLICVLAVGPGARADLLVPEPSVNVGDVRCGAPLAHVFRFTNAGPDPVEVLEIRPSCGCLTPQLGQRRYQPGEQGSLRVEINTLSQAAGPHRWPVRLVYRCGGQEREATLELVGKVFTEITVEPSAVTLFTNTAIQREIVLTDARPKKLTVTSVQTTSAMLSAAVAERSADGAVTRIRLAVGPGFADGRRNEGVTIVTDDPDYGALHVPVTLAAEASSRLSAAPNPVIWEVAAGQPLPARVLLVRDRENERVVIEEVTADDPAITCRWAQGPNNLATVRVTLDRARLKGSTLHSAIHIRISGPNGQTLAVPIEYTAE